MSISLSSSQTVKLYNSLPTCLFIYLFICLSIYLSNYLLPGNFKNQVLIFLMPKIESIRTTRPIIIIPWWIQDNHKGPGDHALLNHIDCVLKKLITSTCLYSFVGRLFFFSIGSIYLSNQKRISPGIVPLISPHLPSYDYSPIFSFSPTN